jgi:levanase
MTMPRTLSLVSSEDGLRLRQTPVTGIDKLVVNRDKEQAKVRPVAPGENLTGLHAEVARVEVRVALGSASEAGVVVRRNTDGSVGTRIGVRRDGTLVLDRTKSGEVAFNALFPSVEAAPVTVRDGEVTFTAYLDRNSVEVLADDGKASVTDLLFPPGSATAVATYAVGGTAKAVDVKVTPMRP